MPMRQGVIACCLCICFAAQGQVFSCTDDNGRRTFADHPCGPNASEVRVKPATGSLYIHPRVSTDIEYYDVGGVTFDEIWKQIRSKGPEGWAGYTIDTVDYRFGTVREGAACRIAWVKAVFKGRVRLPRWTDRRKAARSVQERWDAWFPTLERHEMGHIQIGLRVADDVERAVWDVPSNAECQVVVSEAQRRANAVCASQQPMQEDYDLRTDHGRK